MPRAQLVSPAMAIFLLVAAPLRAQDWSQRWADPDEQPSRVDLSASAGGMMPTRWSGLVLIGSISSGSGVLEQVLTRDLRVRANTQFSGAATYWRGRYGFRVQTGFSRSSLRIGATPSGGTSIVAGDSTSVGVDTWLYDVRGVIGLVDYRPSRPVWPYGFLGAGGITYRLKTSISPPLTFLGTGPIRSDASGDTIVVRDGDRQFLLAVDDLSTETVFAVNFGVGTDFRIPLGPGGVGLRIEVADHVAASPLHVRIRDLTASEAFVRDDGVRFPFVHHLSATAGIVVQIGR